MCPGTSGAGPCPPLATAATRMSAEGDVLVRDASLVAARTAISPRCKTSGAKTGDEHEGRLFFCEVSGRI
jgi:hypothetical protein